MSGSTDCRYIARFAGTRDDILAVQNLRHRCFQNLAPPEFGPNAGGLDADRFDADCEHLMIEHAATGDLVGCCRLLPIENGGQIEKTYSAQFYGLSGLTDFNAPMVEVGRFCIIADCHDHDVMRLAWGAVAKFVDSRGIEMLFGCSSFRGVCAEAYADAFALLAQRHLAPRRWSPRPKAPSIFDFAKRMRHLPDAKRALSKMPPLLKSYLSMGGWVSDHAVIDYDLGTLHVFTGLEVRAIPPARQRTLRALAL